MTIDDGVLLNAATLVLSAGVAWGIVQTKFSNYDKRLDAHDHKVETQAARILTLEQTVADRVARIETKVDLLLASWVTQLQRPPEEHRHDKG